eukprot:6188892-Pleurochrysis_carterae.AAC.6
MRRWAARWHLTVKEGNRIYKCTMKLADDPLSKRIALDRACRFAHALVFRTRQSCWTACRRIEGSHPRPVRACTNPRGASDETLEPARALSSCAKRRSAARTACSGNALSVYASMAGRRRHICRKPLKAERDRIETRGGEDDGRRG